eukprot:TRINITY_DN16024_c0_g1_i1.p1 TRINITY_DN16024_c0_g1~~TRINITY_DN16024_c0_g1_i1.p1  ORF type:complete len:356 (+),score=119.73 TRINITY_DN16024_c0_g1_i1:38-1069(+)
MSAPSPKRRRSVPDGAPDSVVVITRSSPLAMQQTKFVTARLCEAAQLPKEMLKLSKPRETLGDKVLGVPLAQIGEKGLFTRELQEALVERRAAMAVHSCKDLETNLNPALTIGALLERDEVEDVLIVRKDLADKHKTLDDLPPGSVIGTSSLRRTATLARLHPHLKFQNIRGNIGTRIKTLDDVSRGHTATILALAGLRRMHDPAYESRISQILPRDKYMYAPAQGCLAVECRKDDAWLLSQLSKIHHAETAACVEAERSLMRTIEGGCHVPVGVDCRLEGGVLKMTAAVMSLDGATEVRGEDTAPMADAVELGKRLAGKLLAGGAADIIKSCPSGPSTKTQV